MTKSTDHSPVKQQIGGVFIIVENMPRAVKWYRDILGLPEDKDFVYNTASDVQTIYSIQLGKTGLILDSIHRDTLKPSNNHLFMFDTDDIYTTYDFLKNKDVDIISDVVDSGDVKFFEVLDSEGNKIMFCEELTSN